MKMTTRLATLLTILVTTGPLLSATEVDRLRALCTEQEMQIKQLELKISRLIDTPPPSRSSSKPAAETSRESAPAEGSTYTVKSGDSIERIANKFGTTSASLGKLNGLKKDAIIQPGQKLMLPGKTAMASNNSPAPAQSSARKHKVQPGETFYQISKKYGVSVEALITANPSINHRALPVGQTINISRGAPQAIAKTPTPAPKPVSKSVPSLSDSTSIPVSNTSKPIEKPRMSNKPIKIDKEITYGQFAKNYHTTTQRLDELNGLELDPATVLAQGSELYIPAQP